MALPRLLTLLASWYASSLSSTFSGQRALAANRWKLLAWTPRICAGKDISPVTLWTPYISRRLPRVCAGIEAYLRDVVGLSGDRATEIVTELPNIGNLGLENVRSKVEFLYDLGVKDPARTISVYPQLLGLRVAENMALKIKFFTGLGLTKEEAAFVIERYPQLLGLSLAENLEKKVAYLESCGLGRSSIGILIVKLPQVISLSIPDNLDPKIRFFRSLEVRNLSNMITRFPQVLSYSLNNTIVPKVEFLRKLNVTNVPAIVEAYPQVFGLSINNNILPKIRYLQSVGVRNPVRLISMTPQVLSLNIERTLDPKIRHMRESGVKDVGKLLHSNPQILKLNSERNLKPKLKFLMKNIGIVEDDIESCASLLSLSLDNRIRPRFLELERLELLPKLHPKMPKSQRESVLRALKRWMGLSASAYTRKLEHELSLRAKEAATAPRQPDTACIANTTKPEDR